MRTSGVASDRPLTFVVFFIALAFLVILAGGPMQFLLTVQRTVEVIVGLIVGFARAL